MLGIIRENIVNRLSESYHNDKDTFKAELRDVTHRMKKSKTISQLMGIYDMVNEAKFSDYEYAKLFVEETLVSLNKIDKTDLKKLHEDFKVTTEYTNHTNEALDILISEETNIETRVQFKSELINSLIEQPKRVQSQKINIEPEYQGVFIKMLDKKIKDRTSKLNETELNVLNTIMEGDKQTQLNTHSELISEVLNILDGVDTNQEQISLVKQKLMEMKEQSPTTDSFIELVELKNGLTNV